MLKPPGIPAEKDWLLEEEFREPYRAWKAQPSPQTNGAVLRAVAPILESAASTYAAASKSPLIMSQARKLALDGLQRYNPTRAKLRTHLLVQLQGLRRAAAEQDQALGVPEQVRLERHRLYQAEQALKDDLGREPSTSELADHTGLSPKRLKYIRQGGVALTEGAISASSGPEGYDPAIAGLNRAGEEFVYHSLPPQDQLILEHTLGLHGQPVLQNQEIAAKLRVTPAAISQRKARIQQLLFQVQETNLI